MNTRNSARANRAHPRPAHPAVPALRGAVLDPSGDGAGGGRDRRRRNPAHGGAQGFRRVAARDPSGHRGVRADRPAAPREVHPLGDSRAGGRVPGRVHHPGVSEGREGRLLLGAAGCVCTGVCRPAAGARFPDTAGGPRVPRVPAGVGVGAGHRRVLRGLPLGLAQDVAGHQPEEELGGGCGRFPRVRGGGGALQAVRARRRDAPHLGRDARESAR